MLLQTRRAHLPGIVVASTLISLGVVLRLAEMAFDVSDEAVAVNYELPWNPDTWRVLLMPDPDGGPVHHDIGADAVPAHLTADTAVGPARPWKAPRTLTTALVAWWALAIIPVLPKPGPGRCLASASRIAAARADSGRSRLMRPLLAAGPTPSPVHPLARTRATGAVGPPQLFIERPTWEPSKSPAAAAGTAHLPSEATVSSTTRTRTQMLWPLGCIRRPGTHWRSIQIPKRRPTDNPLVAWLGSSCHDLMLTDGSSATTTGCAWLRSHCTLTPSRSSPSIHFRHRPGVRGRAGEVGFYRLSDCTVPSSETEPPEETTKASPPDAPE